MVETFRGTFPPLAAILNSDGRTYSIAATITGVQGDLKFSGQVDSAAIVDQVAIGGYDIGGSRSLAISQENPVVTEAIGASDRTLPVRINGVDYKILLHT